MDNCVHEGLVEFRIYINKYCRPAYQVAFPTEAVATSENILL